MVTLLTEPETLESVKTGSDKVNVNNIEKKSKT